MSVYGLIASGVDFVIRLYLGFSLTGLRQDCDSAADRRVPVLCGEALNDKLLANLDDYHALSMKHLRRVG